MTRSNKNTFLIILSLALAVCLGLLMFIGNPRRAKAAEDYSADYTFTPGASIAGDDGATLETKLSFILNVNNMYHRDFLTMGLNGDYKDGVLGARSDLEKSATYTLTLYRDNGDSQAPTPISFIETTCVAINGGEQYMRTTYEGSYYSNKEQLKIYAYDAGTNSEENPEFKDLSDGTELEKVYDELIGQQVTSNGRTVTIIDAGISNEGGLFSAGTEQMRVYAEVPSPFLNYYVQLDYSYTLCTKIEKKSALLVTWEEPVYETFTGSVKSTSRSFFYVLNAMVEDDWSVSDFFSDGAAEKANAILREGNTQEITVSYLQEIEGTPFATRTTRKLSVPVISGGVYAEDIFSALGVDCLAVGDAYAQVFNYDAASGAYVAKYWTSAWLRAVTVDGNYIDYFSDINKSYQEYYHAYVDSGVISEGLYEWMWDKKILAEYPQTLSYTPDKIYGLWGMAIVPDTYTINQLWAEMFTNVRSEGNMIKNFSYNALISWDAYNALSQEYEYSWLERAWSAVSGFVSGGTWSATYYLFYAEPGTSVSWIDQSGMSTEESIKKEEQNGVFEEEVEEKLQDIKDITDKVWDSSVNAIDGALSFNWSMIGTVLMVAILAIVGIKVYQNLQKSK